MADSNGDSSPPHGRDPRLEIPEVLRQPVKKPEALKDYERIERSSAKPGESDSAKQAAGWAIAMNFVWTVAAGGLIGWAIQKWAAPSAAPWPLLVGLIVGILVGMGKFIRDALKANSSP
jgi:F0F1-type ATP synthase assembly protein I